MSPDNVLVIACGAAKVDTAGRAVRALDLYAGRQFEVARRMQAAGWTVVVLSAEHGFIPGDRKIATYDRKMDAARAAELAADDLQTWVFHVLTDRAAKVVFFGGETYLRVFDAMTGHTGLAALTSGTDVEHIVGGGCGDHFSVLKAVAAETGAVVAFGRA